MENSENMPVPRISEQFQRLRQKAIANRKPKGPTEQIPIPGTQADKLAQVAQREIQANQRLPYRDE